MDAQVVVDTKKVYVEVDANESIRLSTIMRRRQRKKVEVGVGVGVEV